MQPVPGRENKGCYFSLMTALGSEIEPSDRKSMYRFQKTPKRYTGTSLKNELHQTQQQFSLFFFSKQKQDILRKRTPILDLLCLDLLSGTKDLALMDDEGKEGLTCLSW